MRGLIFRAVVVAGAAVALQGPVMGVASTAGTAAAEIRLAAGWDGSGGTWGKAEEVPGTAKLNTGGGAGVASVSCASAGNCSAGGSYTDSSRIPQAFAVDEVNGTWGKAEEVPGTAKLNAGAAGIAVVSCASAGNCSAGGIYIPRSGAVQVFVVSQVHGTWGTAEEVPGTATLNTGGNAEISALSCASPGNCSAGGFYTDRSGNALAFVVSQVHGTWGTARKVPVGIAAGAGAAAGVASVSCASAGNCSAGGFYTDRSKADQAFVVDEVNGTWGKAEEVPGTAKLNTEDDAGVSSVSCASAGNCSAGGQYAANSSDQAFVVDEVNGTWGKAEEVPGTATLNTLGDAYVTSVSCASPGDCSASGRYANEFGSQSFVVSEVNRTWGKAKEVPGSAKLSRQGLDVTSVSCASPGNCSAGGSYNVSHGHNQVFVVDQVNGTWGTAEEIPGTAALNTGGIEEVPSLSCAPAGNCSAGGTYTDGSGAGQAFVVSQT